MLFEGGMKACLKSSITEKDKFIKVIFLEAEESRSFCKPLKKNHGSEFYIRFWRVILLLECKDIKISLVYIYKVMDFFIFPPQSHSTLGELFSTCSSSPDSSCNAGDPSSVPGSGRSTGEGIGYPL